MIPQNRLEELLVSAAEQPDKSLDFYRRFLDFEVLVIGSVEEGKTRLAFFDIEGEKVLPIFSSLARLTEAVESEQPVVQMSARALFAGLPDDVRLVLNPGSAFGKEFSADEIAAMLDGSLLAEVDQIDVPEDEEVLLGQPARYPTELVDGLCDRFRQLASIEQAYLAQVFIPSSGEPPHYVIGLRLAQPADAPFERLLSEVARMASEYVGPDDLVDFVEIGSGAISDYMVGRTSPFYVRIH